MSNDESQYSSLITKSYESRKRQLMRLGSGSIRLRPTAPLAHWRGIKWASVGAPSPRRRREPMAQACRGTALQCDSALPSGERDRGAECSLRVACLAPRRLR
jgi:hypothetical protein